MKRGKPLRRTTPLAGGGSLRRTPMKRGTTRMSRSRPIAPRSQKPRPGDVSPEVAAEVVTRSGGVCERCRVEPATDMHHRVSRARGGPGDLFNLVHLCSECHHVHAHGRLEYPWYVRGRFIRGVYSGSDEEYRRHYAAA